LETCRSGFSPTLRAGRRETLAKTAKIAKAGKDIENSEEEDPGSLNLWFFLADLAILATDFLAPHGLSG
jgi:hypothetical protein